MICCFGSLLTKSTLLISKLQQGTIFSKTTDDVYQLQIWWWCNFFNHQSHCWSKTKFPRKFNINTDIPKTLHVQLCLCLTSRAYFQVLVVRRLHSCMQTPIKRNHLLLLVVDKSLLIWLILGIQILIWDWWKLSRFTDSANTRWENLDYGLFQTASAFWYKKFEERRVCSFVFSDDSLVHNGVIFDCFRIFRASSEPWFVFKN